MANDEGRAGRLSNLDVSIALSYNRLAHFPNARTLWLALTCFAEGMRPAAQTHLLPDPKEREEAIRILKRYGLLETSGDRLRMLAPSANSPAKTTNPTCDQSKTPASPTSSK